MIKRIYIPTVNFYAGGTLVLATLCKTLRELGYDTRLIILHDFPRTKFTRRRFIYNCVKKNIKYKIKSSTFLQKYFPRAKFTIHDTTAVSVLKVEGIKVQWHPFINKSNSIVIYPEVLYGNPLGARNVARWLLYDYYYKNDPTAYSNEDLFFAYREVFNDSQLNPENHIITIKYFDKSLYRQYNFAEREGNCYIIHKGRTRPDLPKKFDGQVFDHKMTQEELVEMLNQHKYCYCFDPQTFYMKIAAVCGCIPILVMEEGKTEKDYLSASEHHYGVAYGNTPEQIQYAIDTRDQLLQSLDYTEQNIANAQKLVNILEDRFGQIKKINHYGHTLSISNHSQL